MRSIILILFLAICCFLISCSAPQPTLSEKTIWSKDYKTDSCIYKQKIEFPVIDKNGIFDFMKNQLYRINGSDTVLFQQRDGKLTIRQNNFAGQRMTMADIDICNNIRYNSLYYLTCIENYDMEIARFGVGDGYYQIPFDSIIIRDIELNKDSIFHKYKETDKFYERYFGRIEFQDGKYIFFVKDSTFNLSSMAEDELETLAATTLARQLIPDDNEKYKMTDLDVKVTEITKNKVIEIKLGKFMAKAFDHFELFDINGTKVLTEACNKRMDILIDVHHLQVGTYVLNMIYVDGKKMTKTILVQ